MNNDKTAKKPVDIKALPQQIMQFVRKLGRYSLVMFIVFVAAIYGFISFQIYSLSSSELDSANVQSQVTTLTPHIDEAVVKQLQNLKDNSVNVQTLFNKARQNPFAN